MIYLYKKKILKNQNNCKIQTFYVQTIAKLLNI